MANESVAVPGNEAALCRIEGGHTFVKDINDEPALFATNEGASLDHAHQFLTTALESIELSLGAGIGDGDGVDAADCWMLRNLVRQCRALVFAMGTP